MRTCENCKYSEPMVGALACMGQKGMPYVRPTDSCDSWKTMKKTNADRLRSMSDEELAAFLNGTDGDFLPTGEALTVSAGEKRWLDWLKAPVEEVDNA